MKSKTIKEILWSRSTLISKEHDELLQALNSSDYSRLLQVAGYLHHKTTKAIDDPIEFVRIHSILEPFMLRSAMNLSTALTENQTDFHDIRTQAYSEAIQVPETSTVVILIGASTLAHGKLLRGEVAKRNPHEKTVLIALADSTRTCLELSETYSIPIVRPDTSSYLEKLVYASFFVLYLQKLTRCIWWGVPTGMPFVFSLTDHLIVNDGRARLFTNEYVTSKYLAPFSDSYLDYMYTATPHVIGTHHGDSRIRAFKAIYDIADLKPINQLGPTKTGQMQKILDTTSSFSNDVITMSSFSRPSKTSNSIFVQIVRDILNRVPQSVMLMFGWDEEHIVALFGDHSDRVYSLPWCHPNLLPNLVNEIDVYLDPFPFGGGLALVQAMMLCKPVVSYGTDMSHFPDSRIRVISELKSRAEEGCTLSISLLHQFFGDVSTYCDRACSLITSAQDLGNSLELLRSVAISVFVDQESTIL
jgi:hypothetical protein